MKTIKIEGTIYLGLDTWDLGRVGFTAIPFESESWKKSLGAEKKKLAPYTIEVEIDDSINLEQAQISALQVKRKIVLAENKKRVDEIDNKIKNLMAIENKVAE